MANRVNKDLATLTQAERLWLLQLAQGLTNADMAQRIGCSERHYWKLVNGLATMVGTTNVVPTTAHLCALARRRYGRGLAGTARLAKCSPPTLLKRERAGDIRLVDFWIKKGFSGFTIRQG